MDLLKGDAMNCGVFVERLQLNAGAIGISGIVRKGVIKDTLEYRRGLRCGVERDRRALAKDSEAERAQVVHAQDVIGVRVGVKYRVHASEAVAQSLLAEVRAGVNDDDALSAAVGPAQQH